VTHFVESIQQGLWSGNRESGNERTNVKNTSQEAATRKWTDVGTCPAMGGPGVRDYKIRINPHDWRWIRKRKRASGRGKQQPGIILLGTWEDKCWVEK